MKNSADLGGCYPPRPSALVDNTLLDLQNSSYPTQPHSIIAKYLPRRSQGEYLPRRSQGKYSPMFAEPEANNCFSLIFGGEYQESAKQRAKTRSKGTKSA